jgi:DNA primase
MIAPKTLEEVQSKADVVEVISRYLGESVLKKKGTNYTCPCPFHNEKTASFMVSSTKQIYKCFGCGKGGDAISFVKDHQHVSFSEAVEQLASMYSIDFHFDKGMDMVQYKEKLSKEKERALILSFAEDYYHNTLMALPRESQAWQKLSARGINDEQAVLWRLGFAPDNSKNITDTIINRAWYNNAQEIGLIVTKSGVSYDFYRNRIIIPIKDHNGNLCGFSGRSVDDQSKYAKYINPPESDMYDKKSLLFGLFDAKAAIKQFGYAYLVEGNFDVVSMHLHGVENTVAPCGTALTEEQVRLLKRYTHHVVIIGDGDPAGIKAMDKQIDLLLQYDFRTEIVELPIGEDPDSFIRSQTKEKSNASEAAVAA